MVGSAEAGDNAEFVFDGYDSATRTLRWEATQVTASGSVTYEVTIDEGAADDSARSPTPPASTPTTPKRTAPRRRLRRRAAAGRDGTPQCRTADETSPARATRARRVSSLLPHPAGPGRRDPGRGLRGPDPGVHPEADALPAVLDGPITGRLAKRQAPRSIRGSGCRTSPTRVRRGLGWRRRRWSVSNGGVHDRARNAAA